ncbi:MAG: response regulator [Planctomycetales bacterium]|nr:response regulator [Planctomycetales bacterium]
MTKQFRIGVAEDEPDMREFYEIVIPELGHQLLWAARSGVGLLKNFEIERPDLLIVDVQMPFLGGLEAVRRLSCDTVPVIVVSGFHDQQTMAKVDAEQILAYLVKPIREADLKTSIMVVMHQFEEFQKLRQQDTITLATRRVMQLTHVSEQQAMHRLNQLMIKEKRTLVEVSETILGAIDYVDDGKTSHV